MRKSALLLVVCSLLPATVAWAGTRQASQHVRAGIRHFRAGEHTEAAREFAEADLALPEDARIAFNRACVHAAQGDSEQAIELFRVAALSRQAPLAARSHYNLGCITADKARQVFGESAAEATPEVRQAGLQLLAQAVSHHRDCLDIDDRHAEARHNLEVLRLWIKHMEQLWAEQDRQKQREEMNVLEFLQMIISQQKLLRTTAKPLAGEPDSPRRRQAISTTESAQLELAEEIDPLRKKIADVFQPGQGQPGQGQPGQGQPSAGAAGVSPPADVPDAEQALQLLNSRAEQAGNAMVKAAQQFSQSALDDAVTSQTESLDALNEIYMVLAPLGNLLARATAGEQQLVDQSNAILGHQVVASQEDARDPAEDTAQPRDHVDFDELARDQTLVQKWTKVMWLKAKQQLRQLQSAEATERLQTLKTSLRKTVELAPKIQELAAGATADLQGKDAAAALPKQEEALKLLQEIADAMADHGQDQNPQHQQQQQENERDQSQQSAGDQPQPPEQAQRDLSRQQAEAVLSRARQRQRQHRELQKQLRGYLGGPAKVDKDW